MTAIRLLDAGGVDGISMVDLDNGYRVPLFMYKTAEPIKEIWKNLDDLKCRDDDVLLCTFPKSGTNWVFEILYMILNKKAEQANLIKIATNLEAQSLENMEKVPSPRILNTHIHYRYIPKEIKEKGIKTVLVMRNPKDTAVSYYNHCTAIKSYDYSGKWENWLQTFMNGEIEYGTYESYLLEWEKAIEEGPGFPLHVTYYEDLKENGVEELEKLAKFLGVDIDHALCVEIEKMCQFKKMKATKMDANTEKIFMKENKSFFRKGEVGDWKNWFTVAQNEAFDKLWTERMKTSKLTFKYEGCSESFETGLIKQKL